MAGTFHHGDLLLVIPAILSQLHSGDVIAFDKSAHSDYPCTIVVHRVMKCTMDGVITQGDALVAPDATLVRSSQLIGRVVRVQRGNKPYAVWGGFAGRLWARYVRFQRRLLGVGREPYRWLRASGIVRRLWHPPIVRMTLATAHGPMHKYLYGRKTIAVWQPETQSFWCHKPYDLVLDAPGPATNDQRINE